MRDFLPDEVRRRAFVIDTVRRVYEGYGFEPLETPSVENLDTLLGKYGDEGNKLIFKILKRGERAASGDADLALRYDLTVPLARVVAEYHARLPRFFKRYQIQPVWRADRPARGRFREFYQCDIDAVGSTSLMVEAEICAAVCDVLTSLGFHDFILRINHRRVLDAVLTASGVPADRHAEALVALDKRDKVGTDGVRADLAARGIDPASLDRLLPLVDGGGPAGGAPSAAHNAEILAGLRVAVDGRTEGLEGLRDLEEVLRLVEGGPAAGRVAADASLARGLSYYTGLIMEVAVPDLAGSLGGGGRYDGLVGMFLGRDVPACGFSLGLERIIVVMGERQMFPDALASTPADVLVTRWDEASGPDTVRLATELRQAGLRVDVYPEPGKVGRQVKYAADRGIPLVVFVGEEERGRGEVALKDLRAGAQIAVERARLGEVVRAALDAPRRSGAASPSAK
jgi:histidyl-tRNA synthetase